MALASLETWFWSAQLQGALAADLSTFADTLPDDPLGEEALAEAGRADALFNHLGIPGLANGQPHLQSVLWERVLTVLKEADATRYEVLHKGTAFYFLGLAAFQAEDFERAVFYLDCAVTQDVRLHGPRWHKVPSGMFALLDDKTLEQYGRAFVGRARTEFEDCNTELVQVGGPPLSVDAFRAKLVGAAIGNPQMRSVATALLSFVLERKPRLKQLALAPMGPCTAEPFLLHLFKGGLLFETLLRMSPLASGIVTRNNRKPQLGDFIGHGPIATAMGITSGLQGLPVSDFAELDLRIPDEQTSSFSDRAVRTTWGLRNAVGHSLSIPDRPNLAQYKRLFGLVFGAISLAIGTLYPSTPMPPDIP